MGPGEAPSVFKAALSPLPVTIPSLAVQPDTVIGTLSGLVQVQRMMEDDPACTADGSAAHDTTGAFLGSSLTMKLALQMASLLGWLSRCPCRPASESVTRAAAV